MDARTHAARRSHRDRFPAQALAFLIVVVLGGGSVFAYRACQAADRQLRDDLLTQTRMAAQAVNGESVARLSGSTADLDSPVYLRLKEQLMLVRSINARCRFLYLVGMKGSDVFFFLDSEPADSKDSSPPGQVYTESPEAMRRAFDGIATVAGPYSDRWGTWITAMSPIMYPGTGDVLAVFCMDVDARDWAKAVNKAGLPAILIALLFAMTLIFFFILLRRSEKAMRRIADSEAEARESSQRLEMLVEHVQAGILLIDPVDHKIVIANRKAAEMYGASLSDMSGRVCHQFICPAHQGECPMTDLHEVMDNAECTLTTASGGAVPIIKTVVPVNIDGRDLLLESFVDITERKQAEASLQAALERNTRQQEAVAEIAVLPALVSGDVAGLASQLTECAARVTGVERAGVWLFDQTGDELRCVDLYEASLHRHSSGAVLRRHEYENEFAALRRAKYVDAHDPTTDPRTAGYVEDYLRPHRITSMLDGVIRTGDKNLGVLCIEHVDKPHHWEPDEIAFVCQLSDQVAITLLYCERKQAEESLRQSQAMLESVFRSAPVGIGVVRNRAFHSTNERLSKITQYSAAEMAGQNSRMLYPTQEDYEYVGREKYEQIRASGTGTVETRWVRKDGEIIHILLSSTPLDPEHLEAGVVFTALDITERKRAEEALREKTEEIERYFSTALDLFCIADTNGYFRQLNAEWETTLGYPLDELEGHRFLDLVHPDDVEATLRTVERLDAQEQVLNFVNRYRCKDGVYRWLEWRSSPRGNLIYAAARDITERKRAEKEKERLEAQLRQSQKMEAVGHLAGGVAHDFNNLLQAIIGFTEMVQDHEGPDTENGKALHEVRQAAQRAVDLTRQLLAFGRRQIIQPVNLNLNEVIPGVLKMIRRIIGEHIELRFLPGERLATVCADRGQMEQILMNLCVNARDAMPDGGVLTVETRNVVIDNAYCHEHPWATEGRYALLSVTDTGHGIDKATREQIFEPFFTTKGVGEGTGLGLATVYGIVKQHNGLIDVYSEPGQGTTFKVYIPVVEMPAEGIESKSEGPVLGGAETILVAEDEAAVRELVVQILETAGYTVLAAFDGEEALRLFKEHADTIDMALLDVMMPRLGGRDVMDRIQAECPRMRFLFSSGYSENAIHTNFVIKDSLRLITKPYNRADLLRAVRETLDAP